MCLELWCPLKRIEGRLHFEMNLCDFVNIRAWLQTVLSHGTEETKCFSNISVRWENELNGKLILFIALWATIRNQFYTLPWPKGCCQHKNIHSNVHWLSETTQCYWAQVNFVTTSEQELSCHLSTCIMKHHSSHSTGKCLIWLPYKEN